MKNFRFTWMEFSGSLGDLGLFLPLVIGMTISCGLDIGVIFILAGLMNILTGFLFRQPIPVQPMKAIAAVAITEQLLPDELVAAGLLIGVILVASAYFVNHIDRLVPKAIVRGIQLGVGLKLMIKGASWIGRIPLVGLDSIISAGIIICLLFIFIQRKQPILLYIFLLGFVMIYFISPASYANVRIDFPHFYFHWPQASSWAGGLLKGALPQWPLTLLNSVIAVCALSSDYFPGRGIAPKKMAWSVGLMNLVCVPLGGIPMCHGAGGLAAQYRFGARTGGSVIMLGVLKLGIGLFFGGAILTLLQNYPLSILGPMLIFAGFGLAKAAKDMVGKKSDMAVALVTAFVILGVNTLFGFLAGIGCVMIIRGSSLQKNKKG